MGPAIVTCDENGTRRWQCKQCHAVYKQKFEFTAHLYNHRMEEEAKRKRTCLECGIIFHCYEAFDDHRQRSGHGVEKRVMDKNGFLRYPCELCASMFSTKFYLQKHMEIHERGMTGLGRFPCPSCDMKYNDELDLECHKIDAHNEKPLNSTPDSSVPSSSVPTSSSGCSSGNGSTGSDEDMGASGSAGSDEEVGGNGPDESDEEISETLSGISEDEISDTVFADSDDEMEGTSTAGSDHEIDEIASAGSDDEMDEIECSGEESDQSDVGTQPPEEGIYYIVEGEDDEEDGYGEGVVLP